MKNPIHIFNSNTILTDLQTARRPYSEFLRVPSLSIGLYHLRAGETDKQQPHTEDEAYYVISGRATFRAGDDEQAVGPGAVLFVEKLIDHRFTDITEDLTLLVLFAPPEHSLQNSASTR